MRKSDWLDSNKVRNALRYGEGTGIRVAVIDSGIQTNHPGLEGLTIDHDLAFLSMGRPVVVAPGGGVDVFGHGTAVASVVHRVAPGAVIGSFRVLGGTLKSRNHLIRAGALRAIEEGYQILNCSFGCRDEMGKYTNDYKEWIDAAYLAGAHVVTACNNENFTVCEWPGFFGTCINVNMAGGVGQGFFGTCINVNMAGGVGQGFTYRRDQIVEFAADAAGVRLPWRNGSYKDCFGSSFAAPVVTGYLARLLAAFPDLTVIQAKAILQHHGEEWRDDYRQSNVTDSYRPGASRRPARFPEPLTESHKSKSS